MPPKFKISFETEINEECDNNTNHIKELTEIILNSFSNYAINISKIEITNLRDLNNQ